MSGSQVDRLGLLFAAAGFVAIAVLLVYRRPRLILVGWLLTVCFVPIWFGVSLGPFFPLVSLTTIGAAVVLARPRQMSWLPGDWLLAGVIVAGLLPVAFGGSSSNSIFQLLTLWVPAALLGRVAAARIDLRWINGLIAVILTVVAALAVAEFATKVNPFLLFPASSPSSFAIWGTLQSRGGVIRAEGAFGHSIALGCCLAMAIPLTLASRFRPWLRLAMTALMLLATVLTFSRVAMLGAVVSVVLSALLLRDVLDRRVRVTIIAVVLAAAAVAAPFVLGIFSAAGSESTDSAAYRGNLLTLVPSMTPLGFSPIGTVAASGRLYFGSFRSIDSALILSGLTYGWVALMVMCVGLLVGVWLTVTGRASAATIAVVGQIPALATVALITQYAVFFWFVLGMSVVAQHQIGRGRSPAPSPGEQGAARPDQRSRVRRPAAVVPE